jgi:hypothetical protein
MGRARKQIGNCLSVSPEPNRGYDAQQIYQIVEVVTPIPVSKNCLRTRIDATSQNTTMRTTEDYELLSVFTPRNIYIMVEWPTLPVSTVRL